MAFPIKTCVVCSLAFELLPGKPGFANRCPACSAPEETDSPSKDSLAAEAADRELNEARRKTIRDMLYRKES